MRLILKIKHMDATFISTKKNHMGVSMYRENIFINYWVRCVNMFINRDCADAIHKSINSFICLLVENIISTSLLHEN